MEDKIQRREAINKALIASLTLTIGALSMNKLFAQKQTVSTELDPRKIKRSKKVFPKLKKADPLKGLSANLTEQIEKISISDIAIKRRNPKSLFDVTFNELTRIEKKENFSNKISPEKSFLKNNADILIDQAANLLDRGIRDRDQWDNLAINYFNTISDTNKFFDFDDLRQEEIAAGMYEQRVIESTANYNIAELNKSISEGIKTEFEEMFKSRWNDTEITNIINAYAQISALSSTQNQNELLNLTKTIQTYELAIQKIYNLMQKENLSNNFDVNKIYQSVADEKLEWEINNRKFQFLRDDIDRKYEVFKLLSLTNPEGTLNFQKRMIPLKERFQHDFEEAYARMTTASVGLKEIFGFTESLPRETNDVDFFDKCITWNRKAINWLIRFSRFDQSFVKTITLKNISTRNSKISDDLSSKSKWDNFLATGRIKFSFVESLLPEYFYVRTKGVSIFIEFENSQKEKTSEKIEQYEGMIIAEITPPGISLYRHGKDKTVNIVQPDLPALTLSRIARRNFIRTPEIVGTSILSNTSPFGEWELFFPQVISENLSKEVPIRAINIDFYITARRQ